MLTLYLQTAAPSDPNDLMPGLEPEQVSPGVIGFFATFFVVLALTVLILDFMRRQRRLRYRMAYAREREAAGRTEAPESREEAADTPQEPTSDGQDPTDFTE